MQLTRPASSSHVVVHHNRLGKLVGSMIGTTNANFVHDVTTLFFCFDDNGGARKNLNPSTCPFPFLHARGTV